MDNFRFCAFIDVDGNIVAESDKFAQHELIKQIRAHVGLNQEDFGKKVNVSKSSISKFERGYWTPSKRLLNRLADAYDLMFIPPRN